MLMCVRGVLPIYERLIGAGVGFIGDGGHTLMPGRLGEHMLLFAERVLCAVGGVMSALEFAAAFAAVLDAGAPVGVGCGSMAGEVKKGLLPSWSIRGPALGPALEGGENTSPGCVCCVKLVFCCS